jgi:Pectate lyase superfamily protein
MMCLRKEPASLLRSFVTVSLVCFLQACGGNGSSASAQDVLGQAASSTSNPTLGASPNLQQTSSSGCESLPALPAPPAQARKVTDFGAKPDDGIDDTDAIQRAVDALKPGEWLVFPKGMFNHNKSIWVRTPRVTLWASDSRLHATNPRDQAVILAADGASMYGFTLSAVTSQRGHAPWESRIAIFSKVEATEPLKDNVVRGNRIIAAGAPGTPEANSATSAGIFIYRAKRFLVAENTVQRSLADGIHVTGGASDGRVVANVVRETGDDMIAVVSYLGKGDWTSELAQTISDDLVSRKQLNLVNNVLITRNDVSGQYWGRGISVVGGKDISVRNNVIERATMAAGIYLAREVGYMTFGLNNVLVEGNTIRQVQTTAPAYLPAGFDTPVKTRHGAVEVYSQIFDDERVIDTLAAELAIQDLSVRDNVIEDTLADGVRIGQGVGKMSAMTASNQSTQQVSRAYSGWKIDNLAIKSNRMQRVNGRAIQIFIDSEKALTPAVFCAANTLAGAVVDQSACALTVELQVTGARLSCTN